MRQPSAIKVASAFLRLRRDYGEDIPIDLDEDVEGDEFDQNDNLDREAVKRYHRQTGQAAQKYRKWKKKHYRQTLRRRSKAPYQKSQRHWRQTHKSRVKSYRKRAAESNLIDLINRHL